MFASDYRRLGRESLQGNWLLSVLVSLIAALLGGAVGSYGPNLNINLSEDQKQLFQSFRPLLSALTTYATISGLASFIIGGTIKLGHCRYLLNQHDRKAKGIADLFSQFDQFGNGFCLQLLTGIFTALWTLLFIIPGIVASYRYAMAPFIQAEHPEYTATESISASKELMHGHKFELFCLEFSFIGWAILSVFTLGIGALFLAPYTAASRAVFYRQLSPAENIIESV